MRTEFKPLVRPLGLEPIDDTYHRGEIGGVEIIATQTGIGTQSTTDVTERLLDDHELDHVIVVGIAGGLGPELDVGDLVFPEVVIDRPNGTTHRATPIGGIELAGVIVTSDEFNYPREILDGFITDGVLAVDMETGSVAACASGGRPVDRVPLPQRPRPEGACRHRSARSRDARGRREREGRAPLRRTEAVAAQEAESSRGRFDAHVRRRSSWSPPASGTTGSRTCDASSKSCRLARLYRARRRRTRPCPVLVVALTVHSVRSSPEDEASAGPRGAPATHCPGNRSTFTIRRSLLLMA